MDSVCSAGEGPTSAVESLRSWEAVEEGPVFQEGTPTLWVPDHAVSRCTGCQTQFWLGRRKHHCRYIEKTTSSFFKIILNESLAVII